MNPLGIDIKFTDAAARLLGAAPTAARFPNPAAAQQPLAVGDKLRLEHLPNCPWFVVKERYWSIGATSTTLTIWLDEPTD